MAETEQPVYIGRHIWIRVPSNVTPAGQTYPESVVRACNGEPALVQQTTFTIGSSK